mmetsp:Transcript_19167/g.3091  ORF Transcript_19167/g.3091 Transcript_19167/m.3091 type:complete len:204 (+) Transcript_19167:21-632(+)
MSYPKVPPKPNVGTATRLSEQRRQRLLKLQEREELKGLLVNKFKAKYGRDLKFIDREVENFMKQNTLTEANLQKLDDQIRRKVDPEARSTSSHASKSAGSVKSAASGQSRQSNQSRQSHQSSQRYQRQGQRDEDLESVLTVTSKQSSSYAPDDDDDEWAQILEYDTALYREEEMARKRREEENKAKMKRELDRQMMERDYKKK